MKEDSEKEKTNTKNSQQWILDSSEFQQYTFESSKINIALN